MGLLRSLDTYERLALLIFASLKTCQFFFQGEHHQEHADSRLLCYSACVHTRRIVRTSSQSSREVKSSITCHFPLSNQPAKWHASSVWASLCSAGPQRQGTALCLENKRPLPRAYQKSTQSPTQQTPQILLHDSKSLRACPSILLLPWWCVPLLSNLTPAH